MKHRPTPTQKVSGINHKKLNQDFKKWLQDRSWIYKEEKDLYFRQNVFLLLEENLRKIYLETLEERRHKAHTRATNESVLFLLELN